MVTSRPYTCRVPRVVVLFVLVRIALGSQLFSGLGYLSPYLLNSIVDISSGTSISIFFAWCIEVFLKFEINHFEVGNYMLILSKYLKGSGSQKDFSKLWLPQNSTALNYLH